MATTNDLLQLFNAIADNDTSGTRSIAMSIADKEGKKGRHAAQQLLRGALANPSPQMRTMEVIKNDEMLRQALTQISDLNSIDQIELSDDNRKELLTIMEEYIARWEIKKAGLNNRNKMLFVGPPGCGKSATAKGLGRQLGLPVFILRFDAMIGSYLGQTSQNLRSIFDFIQRTPSVVLIDEIDAISTSRGTSRDIAELDRVVISLMQQLELVQPLGLLICTSNLPNSIDSAVTRRFDLVVKFSKPTLKERKLFCSKLATRYGVKIPRKTLESLRKVNSFADVERVVINEVRQKILDDSKAGMG